MPKEITYMADIGMDELEDNLFRCIVYSKETNNHLCHAFGKTEEECMLNARRIAWAMNNLEDIDLLINETSNPKNATMSPAKLSEFASELFTSAFLSGIKW